MPVYFDQLPLGSACYSLALAQRDLVKYFRIRGWEQYHSREKITIMKKILLISIAGIFLTGVTALPAKAQASATRAESLKDITSYVRSATKGRPARSYLNDIKIKAVRHFIDNFDNAPKEEWYEAPDRFVVTFTLNEIKYRVDYDKKGNWIETYRTYDEDKLPTEIEDVVRSSYYDYKIFLVQEVENPLDVKSYYIHLDGKTRLINLKICNGQMDELQNFRKSKS